MYCLSTYDRQYIPFNCLVKYFWTRSIFRMSYFTYGDQTTHPYSRMGRTKVMKALISTSGLRDVKHFTVVQQTISSGNAFHILITRLWNKLLLLTLATQDFLSFGEFPLVCVTPDKMKKSFTFTSTKFLRTWNTL